MANEIDYSTIERRLFRYSNGKLQSNIDALYGPWNSINEFLTFLGEYYDATPSNDMIPNSTIIGVYQSDGTIKRFEWRKPTNDSGSWVQIGEVNIPDEEDITIDANNLLRLKDRQTTVNQKGYKILRNDVSLFSQMTNVNTIYEVRYAFDLNDGTLVLPQGSELVFNGGSISNCIVEGNNTRIVNAKMTNVVLQGSFVGDFDDKDIELSTTISTHPLAELFACGFERIHLGRDYDIPTLPNISVPNGTREIVIDGEISRAEASSRDTNYLFDLYEVQDCYIHGSGIIIGAKGIAGTNTGEWQHAINMRHCVGIKINGLTIKDFWGDAIAVADYDSGSIDPNDWAKCNSDISISNIRISNIGRNGISVIHADNVKISNCRFENIVNAPGAAIDLEPNVGRKEAGGEYVYPKKYVQNISIENLFVRNCKIAVCTYASYGGYINNINLSNLTTEEMVGSSVSLYMCRNVNVRNAHILGGNTSPTSIFSMSAFYSVSFDGIFCNDQNASRVFTLSGNSKGVNGVGIQISNCFVNGCNLFVQFGSKSYTRSSTDVFIKDSIINTNGPALTQYADTSNSAPHRLRIENCRFTNVGDSAANAVRLYYAENVQIKGCCFEEYYRAVASYHTKNVVFCENYISRTTGTGVMFSSDTLGENYTLKDNIFAPTLDVDYLVDMGGIPCQLINNVGDYLLNFYRVQSSYTNNPKYENANSRFGTTGKRPILPRQDNTIYCNISVNKMQMCIGGKWFNADGTPDGTKIKYI